MACPFTGMKKADGTTAGGVCPMTGAQSRGPDIAEIDENPTVTEYKKLKRVMGMITKFYRDGTELKRGHYDEVTGELAKLDVDLGMVLEQIAVVKSDTFVAGHPKQKDYLRELDVEQKHLEGQRVTFVDKQKEYKEIYQWSEGIVKVCEWLELNLDDYCHRTLGYPASAAAVPELDEETARTYAAGLDEITHNLQESQDFFSASLDGRLEKFHEQEKRLIEIQLEVVRKYPETNGRRQVIEMELMADQAYLQETMTGPSADVKRREKMLAFHSDFLKVLRYHKDKLKVLYLDPTATTTSGGEGEGDVSTSATTTTTAPKRPDPRFDLYNNLP